MEPSRLPLGLGIIAFGASDRPSLLLRARELSALELPPQTLAQKTAEHSLRGHALRVAFFAEDAAQLKKSFEVLLQVLEKGGSAARLEAQGIFLREEAPFSADEVAFMFPGQGSQYVGMLDALRSRYPIIEETLREADAVMSKVLPKDLSSYMQKREEQDEMEAFFELSQTEVLQPAILASDEAIRRLIAPLITPKVVFGHSLGEYGACVAAGVMSLADALRIVAAREGALANVEIPDNGRMLAIGTNEETVEKLLQGIEGYVVVVNKNCPSQTIIGGESRAVEEAEEKLKAAGFEGVFLPVSHAFHSEIVGPGSVPLLGELRKIPIHAPRVPILSNVTADMYPTDTQAPEWIRVTLAKQMASPVEFIKVVERAYALGARVFLEVGPKRAQAGFVADILKGKPHRAVFLCHPKQGELTSFGRAIASLCADGVLAYGEAPSVIPVPALAVVPAPSVTPAFSHSVITTSGTESQPEISQTPPSLLVERPREGPLPAPFFVRQLRLEEAPPRVPLHFGIEANRTCVLYAPGAEHLLSRFAGVAFDVSKELTEATLREKLKGFTCDAVIDLCLFGAQREEDILSAALAHTKRVLQIAKVLYEQKPKRVVVYTPLGGGFGFPRESCEAPTETLLAATGATMGAWKSAVREWHGEDLSWYPLSIIDVPAAPSAALWEEAQREILSASSFEVSLVETSLGFVRRSPKFCRGFHSLTKRLGPESVVVLFGGGRGITASIALQLAETFGCKLALFGRTVSQPEIPAFDRARALFAAKEQLGPTATRSQLQKRAEELLRQKELAKTLTKLKDLGSTFFYQQGDIRFATQVASFLEATQKRFGAIDMIVYGAGIDRSRGLQNKAEAEVEEVLSTFLQSEIFRFSKEHKAKLVILGSLSSRFGNFGQLDYGAAHEALAKVTRHQPSSLVLDFTAWAEIGMAAPLSSTFKERGIDLLPPSLGARVAVEAMGWDVSGEWVVSGKVPQPNLGGRLLGGHAEFFVPWSEVRQTANLEARAELIHQQHIHPAFLIEMAREAAQSLFLPLPLSSMQLERVAPATPGPLVVSAEQKTQSTQEIQSAVKIEQQHALILEARTRAQRSLLVPKVTLAERSDTSARQAIQTQEVSARYEPSLRLFASAWSQPGRLSAMSLPLTERPQLSRHVLARVFLLQSAELFWGGAARLQSADEIFFFKEVATSTAIATVELVQSQGGSKACHLFLQDANEALCEMWRGAVYQVE